jgi:hypothetical protein
VTTKGPPGWQPHQIVSRIDDWIGVADRIPASVAEMIARALPQPGGNSVANIRARMACRQRMLNRMKVLHYE